MQFVLHRYGPFGSYDLHPNVPPLSTTNRVFGKVKGKGAKKVKVVARLMKNESPVSDCWNLACKTGSMFVAISLSTSHEDVKDERRL